MEPMEPKRRRKTRDTGGWRCVHRLLAGILHFGLCMTAVAAGVELPEGIKPVSTKGVRNVFQLSPTLYSGSAPEGDAGFENLRKLGIRTVLSVDGALPEIERAHRAGLRYIHIPCGYDGIGIETQVRLIQAVRSAAQPVYVHCHHGKHRSVTAAAVLAMAREGWTPGQAEAWLRRAGTDTNYLGLYQTVRTFKPPSADALRTVPGTFPETAAVTGLVQAMTAIDDQWSRVNSSLATTTKSGSDLAHSVLLLREQYRETRRLPELAGRDRLKKDLASAEARVAELEEWLQTRSRAAEPDLTGAIRKIAANCKECHRTHRDHRRNGAGE